MSVTITGVDQIIANLEKKLGKSRTTRVVNKALRKTGEIVKRDVEDAVSSYIDTGETHETVIVSNVKKGPPKQIKVGWGEGSRWRLVHLNEFGYTRYGRNNSPRGMGKLQEVANKTETSILPKIKNDLEELTR